MTVKAKINQDFLASINYFLYFCERIVKPIKFN